MNVVYEAAFANVTDDKWIKNCRTVTLNSIPVICAALLLLIQLR